MSHAQLPRLIVRCAAPCLLAALFGAAQFVRAQMPANVRGSSSDLAISYLAERSLRAGSTQNFWLQGGSAEAGTALWRGIGPAFHVTGATTGAIGASSVPLSLVTLTAGPRIRLHDGGKWSPYGEALFGLAHGFNSIFPGTGNANNRANSFALEVEGGVDVRLSHHLFVRAVDVGYLRTQLPNGTNNVQNTLRVGAGVGMTFGRW